MIRDLGIEIGVDIDESPFADVNREIDDITQAIREIDIGIFDEMEREARILRGDFEDFSGTIYDVDDSLQNIDSGSLEDVSGKSGIATRALDALKLGALGVSAAIGGIALSIGTFAMETDATFSKLSAQTGAVGEELEILESTAENLFVRGYGESLDQVTDALTRVKQNIHGLNEVELEDATAKAMLLADVFDSDVNEVTRGTQNLMNAFGISSDKAFDLFTKGAQSGLNLSNDMFDQMGEFSSVAVQAGYNAEELFGVMQRGAQNGVYNLDRVNNAILEFGLRSTDESKATADAMKGLSKETQNLWKDVLSGKASTKDLSTSVINELKAMDDQTLANQIGIALWGTTWEDNTSDVMYSMFETTEAMKGFEGATDAAAEAVENTFQNRMVGAWRDLQFGINEVVNNSGATEFFETIATKAEELVPLVISSSEALFEFGESVFDSFEDGTQAVADFTEEFDWLILGIAGGVATYYAISGAMAIYNAALLFSLGVGPIYTVVTTGMTVATTAFGAAVSFLLSPIGLIVVGIGAAIAIGVLLYKNWDTVKIKAGELKDWLGEKFTSIKTSISDSLEPVVSLFDRLMGKWDSFKTSVSNFSISGAVKKVASFIPGFSSGIGRVPHDMVAEIHKDEAIIPADAASSLRDLGIIDGEGRYPEINLDNLRGDGGQNNGGSYNTRYSTNSTSTVSAPVTIIVQGGNTNDETVFNIREAMEDFFADLGAVMPQVREG
ncbi:MAG: phage tail tape measure protein [Solibacillus sp.]|uniref:phage tail tape measure protein n=1 Tax=Solibacillus sp. TaxID=1909654 RepID=UPI003314A6D4